MARDWGKMPKRPRPPGVRDKLQNENDICADVDEGGRLPGMDWGISAACPSVSQIYVSRSRGLHLILLSLPA